MATTTEIIGARLQNAPAIIAAAAKSGVPLHIACALVEKESNGTNIYGHDAGGVYSTRDVPVTIAGVTYPRGSNVPVTAANYAAFYQRVIGGGERSNGVGPLQLTYRGFLTDARAKGINLADPAQNIAYGLSILAGYLRTKTVAEAGTLYNAGNLLSGVTPYGRDLAGKADAWRTRLAAATAPTPPTPPKESTMRNHATLTADENMIMGKHFTPGRAGNKINKVVLHYNYGDLSIRGIYDVWQTRQASAHYQIDRNGRVGQLVWDRDTAWHAGNSAANVTSIGVEHANGTRGNPAGPLTAECLDSGAHWVAALCLFYKLGRPVWKRNVFPHQAFTSTSCPGPLVGAQHAAYMARAQFWYDQMTGVKPPAPKPPVVAPAPTPTYTTTATALNVRTGPGTSYKTYGSQLPKGTKWYGTGKTSGAWVQGWTPWMRTNKVAPQWVHGDYLRKA